MRILHSRVVSPWMTLTWSVKVAVLSLSRTSRLMASILIGSLRFLEKPCNALGGPLWALAGAASSAAAPIIATAQAERRTRDPVFIAQAPLGWFAPWHPAGVRPSRRRR